MNEAKWALLKSQLKPIIQHHGAPAVKAALKEITYQEQASLDRFLTNRRTPLLTIRGNENAGRNSA